MELNIRNLVIIVFLIIMVLSFLVFLFSKNNNTNKSYKEIIWVFSIILLALIVNNVLIYFFAVIISGLLIATEKFLIYLVSIFKSNNWELWTIIKNYEIKDIEYQDNNDVQKNNEAQENLNKKSKDKLAYKEIEIEIEKMVIDFIKNNIEKYNNYFLEEHIKITDEDDKVYKFDWLIFYKTMKRPLLFIEIKYIWSNKISNIENFIQNAYKWTKNKMLLCLVGEDIDYKNYKHLEKYNNDKFWIVFWNINKNKKIKWFNYDLIYKLLPNLSEEEIVYHKLFWKWKIIDLFGETSIVEFENYKYWIREIDNRFLEKNK